MKKNNLSKKPKKVSEKERLQKLILQLMMLQKASEERILRYEELTVRASKNLDPRLQKNSRRLEEAKKMLEETLVFLDHAKDNLNKITQENSKK